MSKVNKFLSNTRPFSFSQFKLQSAQGALLTVNITTMQTEIETEEKHSLPRYATMPKSLYLSGDFGLYLTHLFSVKAFARLILHCNTLVD